MKKINDGLTGNQRYYRRHKQQRSDAAKKKYYETNGSYWKSYYQSHKEQYLRNRVNFYKSHPGLHSQYYREYYKKNRDKIRLRSISPEARYKNALRYAKYSGLEWNISYSNYFELVSNRCDYCDSVLPSYGHGLDRLNNDKGYIIGNVVPCCKRCNQIRGDNLTSEEMRIAMKAVKQFRLDKILVDVKETQYGS